MVAYVDVYVRSVPSGTLRVYGEDGSCRDLQQLQALLKLAVIDECDSIC